MALEPELVNLLSGSQVAALLPVKAKDIMLEEELAQPSKEVPQLQPVQKN